MVTATTMHAVMMTKHEEQGPTCGVAHEEEGVATHEDLNLIFKKHKFRPKAHSNFYLIIP